MEALSKPNQTNNPNPPNNKTNNTKQKSSTKTAITKIQREVGGWTQGELWAGVSSGGRLTAQRTFTATGTAGAGRERLLQVCGGQRQRFGSDHTWSPGWSHGAEPSGYSADRDQAATVPTIGSSCPVLKRTAIQDRLQDGAHSTAYWLFRGCWAWGVGTAGAQ